MTDPIDPSADRLHELLQRAYRNKRRRWAWKVGRPYSEDIGKPEPGVLNVADEDEG